MDGIDEPGPNLWESPDDSKKAELGIVALWADTNAGVDKQTWVFKPCQLPSISCTRPGHPA